MENKDYYLEEINRLKLKIKDQEEQINALNLTIANYKSKEASISSAIIFAVERSNQLESSRKKLYQLDLQRSRLLYMKMEQVLNELYNKYPELKTNPRLTDIAEKFRNIVFNQIDNSSPEPSIRANSIKAEDPIRKLLSNVINYIEPRPASGTKKESTANVPKTVYNTPSKSGFDYNEALHPTENLQEILKAFNLDNKNSQNK